MAIGILGRAGGGVPLVGYAYSDRAAGDYTTTSPGFVDLDSVNTKPTLVIGAHRCRITLSAVFSPGGGGQYLAFVAAGTLYQMYAAFTPVIGWQTIEFITPVLAAGATQFNVQWATDAGTARFSRSANFMFNFSVQELPY